MQERTQEPANKPLAPKKREAEQLLRSFLDFLRQNYTLTNEDFHRAVEETKEDLKVPNTTFHNKPLSPLECLVKFLKENCSLTHKNIAEALKRDTRTIWLTYRNATRKQRSPLNIGSPTQTIPLSAFSSKKTVFESAVLYLKDRERKNFHDIGILLQRDERNIWATYHRAKKKAAKQHE